MSLLLSHFFLHDDILGIFVNNSTLLTRLHFSAYTTVGASVVFGFNSSPPLVPSVGAPAATAGSTGAVVPAAGVSWCCCAAAMRLASSWMSKTCLLVVV